jgi:hypothetical protein
MRKKYTIRLILVIFAVSIAFLLFSASPAKPEAPSKETLDSSCTSAPEKTEHVGWESLSRQFFSSL